LLLNNNKVLILFYASVPIVTGTDQEGIIKFALHNNIISLILELPANLVTFRVSEPFAEKAANPVFRKKERGKPSDL